MEGAKTSFIHAMDRGLFVGAGIALLGSVVSLIWLPNRAAEAQVVEVEPALREPAFATEGAE